MGLELLTRKPDVGDKGLTQLVGIHTRWRNAGQTVHLFAAQCRCILDGFSDAILEFADAVGQYGDAALSLGPVACRKIVEDLGQAVEPVARRPQGFASTAAPTLRAWPD